jgi:cytochrome c oxidase cbb3-type subunit 1
VIQNFFGTVAGRWCELGQNLPAKFLVVGSLMYLIGCFQGSISALRSVQQPTHFTDFVIAHSHLTIFGTFIMWAVGGAVYVWPRLAHDQPLWSFRVGNWGFWLMTGGISSMGLVLVVQGLHQGVMLMGGADWMQSVNVMRPYWWVRTLTGIAMDIGISLVVYTLMKTSLSASAPERVAR